MSMAELFVQALIEGGTTNIGDPPPQPCECPDCRDAGYDDQEAPFLIITTQVCEYGGSISHGRCLNCRVVFVRYDHDEWQTAAKQ